MCLPLLCLPAPTLALEPVSQAPRTVKTEMTVPQGSTDARTVKAGLRACLPSTISAFSLFFTFWALCANSAVCFLRCFLMFLSSGVGSLQSEVFRVARQKSPSTLRSVPVCLLLLPLHQNHSVRDQHLSFQSRRKRLLTPSTLVAHISISVGQTCPLSPPDLTSQLSPLGRHTDVSKLGCLKWNFLLSLHPAFSPSVNHIAIYIGAQAKSVGGGPDLSLFLGPIRNQEYVL